MVVFAINGSLDLDFKLCMKYFRFFNGFGIGCPDSLNKVHLSNTKGKLIAPISSFEFHS